MQDEDFNQEMETLGPEAAVDKFQEILEVFAKDKCITTLSRFYRSINILGYAKLRNAMKEQLPPLVQKLWKEKSNEEACQVARILCYILLLEKTYFDEEAVDDIWKGLFTKEIKSIKKSPVMALLTVLLTDDHEASEILSTHSFPLKMENEADTWEFVQFVNIIRDHKEVLLHVHATVANNMVAQVLNYYQVTSGGEDYLQVIQEFLENKELKNRPDFTRDITSEVKMEEGDSQPELIKEKEQIKLKYLIEVADTRSEKLKDIIKVLPADKCIKLLTKLPSKVKNNEKACALVAKYLIKKLPPTNIDKLLDILIEIADIDGLDPCVLNLCAEFVKASATKPTEREIVTLSLSIASSYNQKDFDVDAVMAMESLLHKCILYAHDSINNDRVALYSLLLIHYFHALQKVVERKDVDETLKENMSYHCVQICRIITQHKIYFQRNVVFIISEILESPFLATYRLHQIADPPSRALLAIGLPPKAKRRYAKLLPVMKNASRFVA